MKLQLAKVDMFFWDTVYIRNISSRLVSEMTYNVSSGTLNPTILIFSPCGGGIPKNPQNSNSGPLKSEYLKNGKSQRSCHLEFNISSTGAF